MSEKLKGEIELQHIFDKVDEALLSGSYSLRRRGSQWTAWTAFTTYDQEEVQGVGSTPGEALICFLVKLLEYEQARSADHEDTARASRDRIDRVKRAIESL